MSARHDRVGLLGGFTPDARPGRGRAETEMDRRPVSDCSSGYCTRLRIGRLGCVDCLRAERKYYGLASTCCDRGRSRQNGRRLFMCEPHHATCSYPRLLDAALLQFRQRFRQKKRRSATVCDAPIDGHAYARRVCCCTSIPTLHMTTTSCQSCPHIGCQAATLTLGTFFALPQRSDGICHYGIFPIIFIFCRAISQSSLSEKILQAHKSIKSVHIIPMCPHIGTPLLKNLGRVTPVSK